MTDNDKLPVEQVDFDAAEKFGTAWGMNSAGKYGLANLLARHRFESQHMQPAAPEGLMTNAHDPRTLEERLQWIADWSEPDIDLADAGTAREALDKLRAQAAEIERMRKSLHDIYWEAMNLGTTHKWLASNDGEIDEYSPSYTVSQVLHEFARKVIKTAAQQHGVELFK